ncbi:C-GCAxxG-C-C family protein [Clostridium disporicum]|uniref:C_GCAxxG_C_C family probable redox protein n=1 Tax=Clostridium disporicum TaxID=84024 RepID=A0A174K4X1_9CLOT|nr:C-GCAxxG-C-C family protein [Clostridium disporicum]CUP05107.1 C_GCAxxG_C_C family probable redox protein [Clostridium disporicum]
MGERKNKAIELHSNRYTCSQAVACAFCDLVDVDDETMKSIVRKYSGGTYKVCGAVMGAYVIVNYLKGNINPDNPAEWIKEDEELLHEIERRFKEKNTSVMCKDLKGITTGNVLRSCRGCVEDAAEILEELLAE